MGVGIALDDFGTGYSSMIYLKQLPIRVIKMDKSFIGGITENSKEEAIARAIIALAHSMDLVVVAEVGSRLILDRCRIVTVAPPDGDGLAGRYDRARRNCHVGG